MVLTFKRVNLQFAGVASCADGNLYIHACGYDLASVHVIPSGTWSTAVLTLKKSNSADNAGVAYDGVATLASAAPLSEPVSLTTEFLVVDVTTPEGSACFVDIHVHLRKTQVAQVAAV